MTRSQRTGIEEQMNSNVEPKLWNTDKDKEIHY